MWAPKLATTEAFASQANISSTASRTAKPRKPTGHLGLRVVELIEAATSSMRGRGETVDIKSMEEAFVIPFVDLKGAVCRHQG